MQGILLKTLEKWKKSCIFFNLSYVSNGAVGFVKSVRNPSFSGGAEALNCAKKNGFGDFPESFRDRFFASFFS